VPITRLTVIEAEPFADGAAAERWLAETERDRDALENAIARALAAANTALHAHALATHDPAIPQLARSTALAVRVGFGTGDDLANGRWTRAVEVPDRPERRRRTEALQPSERVAAMLGGRERAGPYETLLLRARADLDAERLREAALQLRIGAEAMLAEMHAEAGSDQAADLAALGDRRAAIEAIAMRALEGEPTAEQAGELEEALHLCERILRRRRILGE
jgi:hypothetical protein